MYIIDGRSFVSVKHCHFESDGTPEAELLAYLRGRASAILYINHPFPDTTQIPLNTTVMSYGPVGECDGERTAPLVRGNALLFYLKDLIFTVYYVWKSGRVYDLYVGSDNLNTLSGLVLRMLGRVKRVAFYVIDFTPVRFTNRLMNGIYQAVNKFACYHADVIWNVSPSMIQGRESIGIRADRSVPQVTVPLGCGFDRIPRRDISEIDPHAVVYFGALREEHGPGLILEALPAIRERYPDVTVTFAGGGPLRETLEQRAAELGVDENVCFTGFIERDTDIYDLLSRSGVGLATYPAEDDTYKRYCDPGKVKIYLAAGLPVMITDVPAVARELADRDAGRIVKPDPGSLARAVIELFDDLARHEVMRQNAMRMASEYTWTAIWDRTFASLPFEE